MTRLVRGSSLKTIKDIAKTPDIFKVQSRAAAISCPQYSIQHPDRVFDHLFQVPQEKRSHRSVDNPVIARKREYYVGLNLDVFIFIKYGLFTNFTH
jgi:hypothetical protein